MTSTSRALAIVSAGSEHEAFIRRLSASAFARFGDYESFLGRMMRLPWVVTFVAETDGRAVGFAMVSFEDAARGELDITAIAVQRDWRSRGVGRRLLRHVEATAASLVPGPRPASVRLSVAEDNLAARRLFEAAGFARVPDADGEYPAGQRSHTLRKSIRAVDLTPDRGDRKLDR